MSDEPKTTEKLRQELRRLEDAVSEHITWMKDWHLQVLGAAMNGEVISTSDDDIQIPFQKWYYSHAQEVFGDSPAYPALGFSLAAMQSQTLLLAEKLNETGKFPLAEYKEFMESAAAFNEMTFKLQRESLFQVAQIDDLTGAGDVTAMRDYL